MKIEVQDLVMKADDLLEAVLVYMEKNKIEHKGLIQTLNESMELIKELDL